MSPRQTIRYPSLIVSSIKTAFFAVLVPLGNSFMVFIEYQVSYRPNIVLIANSVNYPGKSILGRPVELLPSVPPMFSDSITVKLGPAIGTINGIASTPRVGP